MPLAPAIVLLTAASGPQLVTDAYVDDARCARCHADISHGFQSLGMGRSFHVPGPDMALADFSEEGGVFHHEASGQHYRMWMDDEGRMWMRQFELDAQGDEINGITVEAHFAVGSGNHARTWLHRSPSGELWELPVSWYTESGWNMSPGYDRADQSRFSRQVSRECIFCHTAYPDVPAGEDRAGRPEVFPEELPSGIGCQRCHGPGKKHVDLAYSADATDEEIAASILNPADLDPVMQDEICLQCHLQPTSRLHSLVRPFDRGEFSYRPGEPLSQYLAHVEFEQDDPAEAFEVNHHGWQIRQSACWQGEGALTCLSCHDPHHKPLLADRVERYRQACLSCHEELDCTIEAATGHPLEPGADCTTCHMPKRRPADAIHTVVTDHRIQLPPADPEALVAPRSESAPPAAALAKLHRGSSEPDELLTGLARIASRDDSDIEAFAAALPADAPARTRLLTADGLLRSGHRQQAEDMLRSLLITSPWMVPGQVNLALIEAQKGDVNAAIERMLLVVRESPHAADAWSQLGPLYWRAGRTTDAVNAASEVVRLRPLDAKGWHKLGTYLAAAGAMEPAAASFARSEALMPGNESNAYNLGLAMWKSGRRGEAHRAWMHALGRSPDSPQLLKMAAITTTLPFDGLGQDTLGQRSQAGVDLARRWVDVDKDNADALVTLAAAQHLAGSPECATTLQQATQRGADPAAIAIITAMHQAQGGDADAAKARWQQVSSAINRPDRLNTLREGLLNAGRALFGS
ncbi:MAG: hypothetical protein MK101_03230 [Phycisphaerales bacterium]|nr:hypothetical protein [Phycisphaerales bacterium]